MNSTHQVYISLGSNKGDRLKNLQEAVDLIFQNIGKIKSIAKVYNTPALGFEGDDFLNTCISIQTRLAAEVVLEELLSIEKQMGRERTNSDIYESRIIDLDILFYDEETINSEQLTVPHPKLQERQFVLDPLKSIAPKLEHPVLNKTDSELADGGVAVIECMDLA